MKKSRITLVVPLALVLCLVLTMILGACTTSTPTSTAPSTTTPAVTTPTAPAIPAALQKVIDAAKQEGKVNYFCGGHVYDGVKLSQGIKDAFGVDIEVTVIPGDQRKTLSTLQMEMQAGTKPSFDVMNIAGTNVLSTMRPNNMLADIDWKSLFTTAINPQVMLPAPADYPCTWSYIYTLAYNSAKVSEQSLPKSFKEMTDAKYSGKYGWISYTAVNSEIVYFSGFGDEAGKQFIQDMVNNKPTLQGWDELANKITLGELDFTLLGSHEFNRIANADPKTPYKWSLLKEFCLVTENTDAVLNGAANVNAGTLLVLYLCTPEGQAYNSSTNFGNYLDPGSNEYKIVAQAKQQNIPIVYAERDKDYVEWLLSPKSKEMGKALDVIMKKQ